MPRDLLCGFLTCRCETKGLGAEVESLSAELQELMRRLYAPECKPEARAALLAYGADRRYCDRVRFDMLYLGEGDVGRVRKLGETAKRDPRDVMTGEYFRRGGRSYPHAWARRHAVNREMPEPE